MTMICNELRHLKYESNKLDLEVNFLKLKDNQIEYIVLSKKVLSSNVEDKETDFEKNLNLNQEKILSELFSPTNLQKYYSIAQNKESITERVFITDLDCYLDIHAKPLNNSTINFNLTLNQKRNIAAKSIYTSLNSYQHLLENSSDWVIIINDTADPLFVCHSSKNILGYAEADYLKINSLSHISPSDQELARNKFQEVKREHGKTVKFTCNLIKADSTYIKVELKAKNCFDIEGINGIVVTVNDVSDKELITENIESKLNKNNTKSDFEIEDLINFEELNKLMKIFQQFSNMPIVITDLAGKILTSINMTDICTKFHRIHPLSNQRCRESDINLTKNLQKDEIKYYKCFNNMNDLVSPIYIGNRHIANFFVGEFFFTDETVDYDFFKQQAKKYGFNEKEYLEALDKVPRIDRDKVMLVITFYHDLIKIIATLAQSKIKLLHLNNNIEKREEKLKQITDNMTDVVLTTDFDFTIKYISPSIEKLTGYSPAEYLKLSMEERYPPLAVQEIRETIAEELLSDKNGADKNRSNMKELVLYNKQRKLIVASIHSKFLRDGKGNPIAIIANIRDITDRIKVEYELEHQINIQSLLNTIAVKYINIPTKEIEGSINESLEQMATFVKADRAYIFEYNWEKQIITLSYQWLAPGITNQLEILQDIDLKDLGDFLHKHKNNETIIINDFSKLAVNSKIRTFFNAQNTLSQVTVPISSSDQCFGFVGFDSVKEKNFFKQSDISILSLFAELIVNLTNRVTLENDLREERKKAQNSDDLKSNLLKNISHEFRTPLNGIVGFSELLQQQSNDFDTGNMASMIYSSAIRLNHVLDSIMLLTQLEDLNKKSIVNLKTKNVSKILEDLSNLFQEQFKNKSLAFNTQIEDHLYGEVDEKLLNQAIIHLLNNALKFTHTGGVKLICRARDKKIVIDVIDTGVGIPNESLKIIFSDFRQASEGYNRAYEGVGLGLTIAKKTVDLMQGEISVKSKILEGSTFTITLPLSDKDDAEIKELEQYKLEQSYKIEIDKPKILIVEDNIINQKLVISILKEDFSTDLAVNGEVAITLAEKKKYDAILMDIHLGEGIDGIAATKIIRKSVKNFITPIIAVTGYTMYGDKDRILAEGCNYYLSKPYKKKELLKVLNGALSNI